jgi:hypothetical protein
MAHFIESGKLTLSDIEEAKKTVENLAKPRKKGGKA